MGTELQGAGGRVGDAFRNRTADLLKKARAGYLTLEETDERLGTALAARLPRRAGPAGRRPATRVAGQSGTRPAAGRAALRLQPRRPGGGRLAGAAGDGHHRRDSACGPHPRLLVLPVATAVDLLLRLRPPGPGWLAAAPLVTGLVPARARRRSRGWPPGCDRRRGERRSQSGRAAMGMEYAGGGLLLDVGMPSVLRPQSGRARWVWSAADQPQGQRIPVGLALAGLGGGQRGQHHQATTPTAGTGMPTSSNAATSTSEP